MKVNPFKWVLWHAAYRPFFLGAASWAVFAMLMWFGVLNLGWSFPFNGVSPAIWHGHEMVYGISAAVVAGFLLTAAPKWTDTKPMAGGPLALSFTSWLAARISALFGSSELLPLTASLDLLFITSVLVGIAVPIMRLKQWSQTGVLVKVLLLGVGNGLFYLGVMGVIDHGAVYGLYSSFYLIIALILTFSRRVMPFFIERRLRLPTPLQNFQWLDRSSLILFLVFWGLQVFSQQVVWGQVVALALFALHAIRIYHWYRPGIWSDPLLWVLFVAYGFLVLAFSLVAAPLFGYAVPSFASLHLFAVGGIGLIICGMMARISLGHSGRDVRSPPKTIGVAFLSIAIATIVRVFFPLFDPAHYLLWIAISQWFWMIGFAVFLLNYTRILISPRADGKLG